MAEVRFGTMWDAAFGNSATKWNRRRPTLESDGSIHLTPEDGVPGPRTAVRANIQYTLWMETPLVQSDDLLEATAQFARGMRDETAYRIFHASVFLTDCRLIVEQDQQPRPNERSVGHIRYPWISSVGFRPKQSFLNECTLEIAFQQEMSDDAGSWFHRLELTFDKSVDSGAIATDLVHRVARHQLNYGAPETAREEFERLAVLPRPADPPKGKLATTIMPAFQWFPRGAEYIADGHGKGDWLGPGLP